MKIKNISDHDERDFFCAEILFAVLIKYITTFFDAIINNNINDIVFFRWEKIDNKIYNDVSSVLFQNK